MKAGTSAIILFLLAAFFFYFGVEWMALVFLALGLGFVLFYKDVVPAPEPASEASQPIPPRPQQVIVLSGGGDDAIARSMAGQFTRHIQRTQVLQEKNDNSNASEISALKKEMRKLKKAISKGDHKH